MFCEIFATSPLVWEVSSVFTLNYTKGHKSYRNNFCVLDQQGLWEQVISSVMTRENKDYDHIACQDAVSANYLATAQLDRPVGIHLLTTLVNENSVSVMVESTLESYSKHANGKGVPCLELLRLSAPPCTFLCRIQQHQ